MKSRKVIFLALTGMTFILVGKCVAQSNGSLNAGPRKAGEDITIHTERYPRLPYSTATYFIYEKNGLVICTKLQVCDKYNSCESTYARGAFKDPIDKKTGVPFGTTQAVLIPKDKLFKHVCLSKFSLMGKS